MMRARTSCGGSSCTRDRSWTAASMTILPVLAPVLIVLCGGEREIEIVALDLSLPALFYFGFVFVPRLQWLSRRFKFEMQLTVYQIIFFFSIACFVV